MLTLTNVLTKMMNFKNVFRWHLPFLLLVGCLSFRAIAADNLLILGDSLSAVYRLPVNSSWPSLLNNQWQKQGGLPTIINASISGDTAEQGLARLPGLLAQHHPRWVLIELGANDGLRGFAPATISQTLQQVITLVKQAKAQPLLLQIRLPPKLWPSLWRCVYAIYPALAKQESIPLVPFFMEPVAVKPQWMQDDGLHPNQDAQAFISNWMSEKLLPFIKQAH